MKLTDRRTGGFRMCKCGKQLMYHRQEPRYYRAEELDPGNTQSVAERDKGCKGFEEDPDEPTFVQAFRRRLQ